MLEIIKKHKIIPVVVLNRVEDTMPVLTSLCNKGLPIAEITFRTDCAAEAIRLGTKHFHSMTIGAGTVINEEQCKSAIEAGAKFIVSPGLSEEVATVCKENSILYIPGVVTPSEIIKAISLGLTVLKFFPAESYGGLKTIKALSAAFPKVSFIPTGGINNNNIDEYLAFEKIIACGGTWMLK